MHVPDLLGWVKRSDIEIVQIELSDLIDFGYDLNDIQDGLTCWKMGFIFCCKHPLLLTAILMSDPAPMCPLVYGWCWD